MELPPNADLVVLRFGSTLCGLNVGKQMLLQSNLKVQVLESIDLNLQVPVSCFGFLVLMPKQLQLERLAVVDLASLHSFR